MSVVLMASETTDDRGGGGHELPVPAGPPQGPLDHAGPAGQDRLVGQEPPQVGGQLLGRRVAMGQVLGHRLQDDRLQVAGDRRVEPARRDRLVQRDLAEQLLVVAAVEGGPQRQQLVEGHAQGVDVGPLIDDPAPGQGLLGAHVAERPDHVAGAREAEVAGESRQAEVGDPDRAVGVDQEVGRLDVAMEDAQAMGVVQRIGRLDAQPGDVAAEVPVLMDGPDGRRRRDGPPAGEQGPGAETASGSGVTAPVDRAGLVGDRRGGTVGGAIGRRARSLLGRDRRAGADSTTAPA